MTKEKATVDEAEVVEAQTSALSTPRAVMVSASQLKKQMTRDNDIRKIVDEYIKTNMKDGKDYGSITVKGHKSKPSLFKPGSEKFCGLFKLRPTFKKDVETVEMMGDTPGIIAYICELVDQKGNVVGEGRGIAKTDPKSADFDINKQVKIAEKRAQIDAVLRTGGLSDFFTQDLEDAPKDFGEEEASGMSDKMPTDKQIEYARSLMVKNKIAGERANQYINAIIGKPVPVTMGDYSRLIQALKEYVYQPSGDVIVPPDADLEEEPNFMDGDY